MTEVLVVHPQNLPRLSLVDQLRRLDLAATGVADLEQARAAKRAAAADSAVLVIGVERAEQIPATVLLAKRGWRDTELIIVGPSADLRDATEAVRLGAYDYVAAGDAAGLGRAVQNALHETAAAAAGARGSRDVCDDPVIVDPRTRAVFDRADRAAMFRSTVLITGESGTGKEVLARRMHRLNRRRHGKFVPVNCGSLPEALVETELFGYKRGAFTGAAASSKGLIEEAEGGVLFLDEIGDMPLSIQGRLLRFLDSGEIRAVGDTSVRHVDVRVVAATNRDVRSEIREKRFREDLFFRLSVVPLYLPPLRDRRADLPALVAYHVGRAAARLGVAVKRVSEDAMALLLAYHWPGNVRELQNALEEALLQDSPGIIASGDLPAHISGESAAMWPQADGDYGAGRRELLNVLRRHNNNHSEAASALGISRTTLWRRLKQHNRRPHLGSHSDSAVS